MGMPRCGHAVRNPEACHECAIYLLRCAEEELARAPEMLEALKAVECDLVVVTSVAGKPMPKRCGRCPGCEARALVREIEEGE